MTYALRPTSYWFIGLGLVASGLVCVTVYCTRILKVLLGVSGEASLPLSVAAQTPF